MHYLKLHEVQPDLNDSSPSINIFVKNKFIIQMLTLVKTESSIHNNALLHQNPLNILF